MSNNKIEEIQIIMHSLGAKEFKEQLKQAALSAGNEYETILGEPENREDDHHFLYDIIQAGEDQFPED